MWCCMHTGLVHTLQEKSINEQAMFAMAEQFSTDVNNVMQIWAPVPTEEADIAIHGDVIRHTMYIILLDMEAVDVDLSTIRMTDI